MTIRLSEAGALGDKKGRTYRCRLIQAGQGSSGFYSESVLSEYGPSAFPVGTHSYLNHKSYDDEWNQPERRVQDIAGVISSVPEFRESALWADITFTAAGVALVEELGEHIGLSIYANGETEDYDGGVAITKIFPSPLNSVDIVTRAGAGGKIMELAESFRASGAEDSTSDSRGTQTERIEMDEKDIKAIADAVTAAIAPQFTALTEALKPVEPATDEDKGVDIAAVAEAVHEAGLPKSVRTQVYEAVQKGAKLEDVLAGAKTLVESIKSELGTTDAAGGGVIRESGTATDKNFTLSGWSA